MMVGVGCLVVPATFNLHHKPVLAEQLDESVTSGHASSLLKQFLDDNIQLRTTQAGIVLPVIFCLLHNQRLYGILGKLVVLYTIIERLPAITKQPGEGAHSLFRTLLPQQTYCLVPDFFLIGMLKRSSAKSIILS